jgi:hypothetical protein
METEEEAMRDLVSTDLLAVAVLVMAVWLLANTLGASNEDVLDVVAAVVVALLAVGALILPRRRV